MFLDNLPNEILTKIISYFSSFNETKHLRLLSKRWQVLSDNNPAWKKFLKDDFRCNRQQSYRTIFQTTPEARKPGYICIDEAGRNYLNNLIDNELQTNQNLTEIQKAHLGSQLVRQLIQTENLTIDQAIQRSSDEQIQNLNDEQREGIKIGLTKQQVETPNFGRHTINAIKNGKSFEEVQGLEAEQIRGLELGLTRQQVETPSFRCRIINAIKDGMRFEDVQGLDDAQITGLDLLNLTRQQVETPNFGWHTIDAMQNGFSFEEVKGLTPEEIIKLYHTYCPDYWY